MANELSALVRLAGASVDNLALTPTESLHRAIADRVFGIGGPFAWPARFMHDRVAQTVYGVVRRSTGATTALISLTLSAVTGDDTRVLTRSRRGRAVVAALNAVAGDLLADQANELAIPMSVFVRGADVDCHRMSLRRAFPQPRHRVAVFLHGLGETPDSWRRGARPSFGSRLRRDLSTTPVYIRYNTGLRITDNGAKLDELLEALVAEWPVRLTEIIIVGHSMGGLVARAALDLGAAHGSRWTNRLRHLIALGSPHTGVRLEQLVHRAAGVLRGVPEARPLADVLDLRSAGIRDLRRGYVRDAMLEETMLRSHRFGGCTHTFITASVSGSPWYPLGWLIGDLLVHSASAAGRSHDGEVVVASDNVFHLAPLTHFDLLDHPLVYRRIREVLTRRASHATGS